MRFAVIPTHDRPELFHRAFNAIVPQVDSVIIVAHQDPEYLRSPSRYADYVNSYVVPYDKAQPNISEMWNLGLDEAKRLSEGKHHLVGILNDDTEVPENWFDHLEHAIVRDHTVLASGKREATPGKRLCGYAFVVVGSTIRADPTWAWWVSEDHFAREANLKHGGWSWVKDLVVRHDHTPLPRSHPLQQQSYADVKRWEMFTGEVL
jgi:hypothetical protein